MTGETRMATDLGLDTSTVHLEVSTPPTEWIPPLQQGDRLTRDEFLRRYEAMPEIKKAELVEGKVYMPSPASAEDHGEPHFRFNGILLHLRIENAGCRWRRQFDAYARPRQCSAAGRLPPAPTRVGRAGSRRESLY
jgi:hypothetical protein